MSELTGKREIYSSFRQKMEPAFEVVTACGFAWALRIATFVGLSVISACGSPNVPSNAVAPVAEWHEFHGIWTAAGNRQTIRLGSDRRASIADFTHKSLI